MHPLVLVGLGVGVGEGLGLEVGLGLGNQVAISTRGCIIWQGCRFRHNTGDCSQLTQGRSKVKRYCQSTTMGAAFTCVSSHRQEAENFLI